MSRRAFTLVELLLVVAIIALLISLLLPALNEARRVTRGVVCQNNLRQLAIWGSTYAGEWQGSIPRNQTGRAAYPYYHTPGVPPTIGLDIWYKRSLMWQTSQSSLRCPEMDRVASSRSGFPAGYAPSAYAGGSKSLPWYPAPPSKLSQLKVSRLLHGQRVWFAEVARNDWYDTSVWVDHPYANAYASLTIRAKSRYPWPWMSGFYGIEGQGHPNDVANFAMGDGHAQSMNYDEARKMNDSQKRDFSGAGWND